MTYSDVVLDDSPVAYWRLGESSGTTAFDDSGGGHSGTYNNSPTLGVAGPLDADSDTAVTFSGSSQDVQVAHWAGLDLATFSLEAWVKTTTGNRAICGRQGHTSVPYSMFVAAGGEVMVVIKTSGTSGTNYTGSTPIDDGDWHHVVVTRETAASNALKIYVDGVLDYSVTGAASPNVGTTYGFAIGSRGASAYFAGTIDEVALYDSVLSLERVEAHYDEGISATPPVDPDAAAGLPDVEVLLDDGTGTFPHDVTTYVRMVEGISLTAGRQDEQSSTQSSTCTLTFDNTDGRFTVGSTTIASPSPIRANQKIRVRLTVSGVSVDRFTGFIQSWPVRWPRGGEEFSTVTITASDALARLGREPIRTPLADIMLKDGATLVYPLTDPEPKYTPGDVVPTWYPVGPESDNAGPLWGLIKSLPVAAAGFESPAFESAEMPNGNGTVVSTNDAGTGYGLHPYRIGRYESEEVMSGPSVSATSSYSLEVAFKVPPPDDGGERIANIVRLRERNFNGSGVSLEVTRSTGFGIEVGFTIYSGTTLTDGVDTATYRHSGDYVDDQWHFATFVVSGGGKTLDAYLDGVAVGSTSISQAPSGTLGYISATFNASLSAGSPVSVGYIGFTPAALTASQIAEHSEIAIGSTGFRSDEVIARYAEIAGVSFTAVDEGSSIVPTFTDTDALALMSSVMDVERGRLYVDGSGTLTFESRRYFLDAVYADTPAISATGDLLNPDAAIQVDTQRLINRARVTRSGGATREREDADSIDLHGVHGTDEEIHCLTDSDADNLAAYLVWLYADPEARLADASFDLLTQNTATQQAFLTGLLGAWLRLTSLPAQSPTGTTADLYIEGYTETISAGAWTLTPNTAPKKAEADTFWRLDDSNFPLETNTKLFY